MQGLSIGKYQTTLYNKSRSPFQSSLVGGLVTLVFGLVIGFFVLSVLLSVFQISTRHYNLDVNGRLIQAYSADGSLRLYENTTTPCNGECT